MIVRSTPPSTGPLYLPFSLISHIDPREAFMAKTRDELHHEFRDPPPRSTVVEERSDPITGEDTSRAFTSQPSGYDGTPVVVVEAEVGELAHHIAPGFRVYSSEMEHIGTIKEYYRDDKRMRVERGPVRRQDFLIPTALLAAVDRDHRHVVLAVSAADLRRQASPVEDEPDLEDVNIKAADATDTR
jgi:hypothetical protein